MIDQQLSWTGQILGDYLVQDVISEGRFSWVYRAAHVDTMVEKAIKFAKPSWLIDKQNMQDAKASRALVQQTGGLAPVRPDAAVLVSMQAKKLMGANDPALVTVEDLCVPDRLAGDVEAGEQRAGAMAGELERSYYRMEYIDGRSLRDLVRSEEIPLGIFLDLAHALARLKQNAAFLYHGDLKPDNVMVTAGGECKLLDPGYFGSISSQEGEIGYCRITTPAYYPDLEPDDLFAFGIMLWEAATRCHPLDNPGFSSSQADLKLVGNALYELVRVHEITGKYFLSPILALQRPSAIRPEISADLEMVLLKALRVQFRADGVLDLDTGYTGFSLLARDLEKLQQQGISYL